MPAASALPAKPGVEAPRVLLREAELSDAPSLAELYQEAKPDAVATPANMAAYLNSGFALVVTDAANRVLAAVRWTSDPEGWNVERVATRKAEREQGYGRWLMTKLEAMAIKGNVKRLTLEIDDPGLLRYYGRMGYHPTEEGSLVLSKRVGGVWQRQAGNERRHGV